MLFIGHQLASTTEAAVFVVCCSYVWHIPVTWRTSHGHSGHVWLKDKELTFELAEPINTSSLTDWIKLNLNETAYCRVNYMTSNWRALTHVLRHNHTVKTLAFCCIVLVMSQ